MTDEEFRLVGAILRDSPAIGSDTPCRRDPVAWDGDDPAATAAAVLACKTQCRAFERCKSWALTEPHRLTGVIAGRRYPLAESSTS
jgi:hypothetical protein